MSADPNRRLPGWMKSPSETAGSFEFVPADSGKKITGFGEKTVHAIFSLFQTAFFTERLARQPGFLQNLDPRAKLLSGLVLLVTISLLREPLCIGGLYVAVMAFALASKISWDSFLRRVWLVVPLYTGMLAIPAVFNWITPGHPVWVLHEFKHEVRIGPLAFPPLLAVTDLGLRTAFLFVLRVGVSVSITILMVLTTPWQKLLRALRAVGVPQFFVFALGMAYRYVHLLLSLVLDWHLGRKSRTLRATHWRQDQSWMAAQMGYLFRRSHHLAENVYSAMQSRGFQNEPKVLGDLQWRRADGLSLAVVTLLCAALLVADFLAAG